MSTNDEIIKEIQAGITQKAREVLLPERFRSEQKGAQVTIWDTETGNEVTIPLGDYRSARKVLSALLLGV